MLYFALKMLIKDKAKYIGIILGLSFASLIITQQAGTFIGIMARTIGFIIDTPQANIWVMDRKVLYIDDIKPLKSTELYRVKGVEGVEWAVPLYKGIIKARLTNGNFQNCMIIGIDDASLIGRPATMFKGNISELRNPDAIIVNRVGANTKLSEKLSSGVTRPLQVGARLEINDHRAEVVGICKASRTFQSQPVIYTTYNRATTYAPPERKLLSFILVKSQKGVPAEEVCKRITERTNLSAYTQKEFMQHTIKYYLTQTAIPINFGITVLLGFVIGTAIAGQTFFNLTLDNLKYFGTFKAMGATQTLIIKMLLVQVIWVATIGWSLGVGAAALFGFVLRHTELSFRLPWQLFLGSGVIIYIICISSALISIRKVIKLEPAIVFKS